MSVRRLPLLLVCVVALGLAAAALSACGGTKNGIPAADAGALERELGDVQEFVTRGECTGLDGQISQVQQGIDNLPSSVDPQLAADLNDGVERLKRVSLDDCNQAQVEQIEPLPETTTTAPPIETTTTPPAQPTTTAPPATETTPPPTVEPPVTTPAPDPTVPPEGGSTPDPNPGGAGADEGLGPEQGNAGGNGNGA